VDEQGSITLLRSPSFLGFRQKASMAKRVSKNGLTSLGEDDVVLEEKIPSQLINSGAQNTVSIAASDKIDFNDLKIGDEIGRGAFSTVYRGLYRGESVAIKKIALTGKDADKSLTSEVALLASLRHPNLIKYFGAAVVGREAFIVTELMNGGNLSAVLRRVDVPLSWRLRIRIARSIMAGIQFLHSNELVHRDIKTENVLLDDHWRVVVADFGFARKMSAPGAPGAMTLCGTDEFMAPEILFGEQYDERADVFSFGVLLFELIFRLQPGREGFLVREPRNKFKLPMDTIMAMAPKDCPPSLLQCAVECCHYDSEYRMTSDDALEWLTALQEEFDAAKDSSKISDDEPPLTPSVIIKRASSMATEVLQNIVGVSPSKSTDNTENRAETPTTEVYIG
jgi:serine/threonine protein kinase